MKWNIKEHNDYLCITKNRNGKYDLEYITELSKQYKYCYKASRFFRIEKFDGKFSEYIFTDILIDDEVFKYVNELNLFPMFHNFNILSLYSMRDKIEIIK